MLPYHQHMLTVANIVALFEQKASSQAQVSALLL